MANIHKSHNMVQLADTKEKYCTKCKITTGKKEGYLLVYPCGGKS